MSHCYQFLPCHPKSFHHHRISFSCRVQLLVVPRTLSQCVPVCAHVKDSWHWYKSIWSPLFLLHWQFQSIPIPPLNLLHPCCHSNVWATNWFSLARWFPYQADCQHGRWEALRGMLLLQQIWWIAQAVSSSPMQTCRGGGVSLSRNFFSHCAILCCSQNGLLDLVFQSTSSCVHVVPSVAILLFWHRPTQCLLWKGKSSFVILITQF